MENTPLYEIKTTPSGLAELYFNGERKSTGTIDYVTQLMNDKVYGTVAPLTVDKINPLGIVSSADVSKNNEMKSAMSSAAGTASGSNPPQEKTENVPMTEYERERLALDKEKLLLDQKRTDSEAGIIDRTTKALELSYNAALARNNSQYNAMRQELSAQYKTDIDYALEAVTAANPYGAVIGGDQSLKNYKDNITAKYNAQALKIEEQATLAQNELEAGRFDAYTKIVNEIEKGKIAFDKEMFQYKIDMNKTAEASAQFNATLQTKYSDDYRSYLTSVPYSPKEIQSMTDEQILNTTAGRLGQKAGLNPEMIKRDMSEASYKSTQQAQAAEKIALTEANQESMAIQRDRLFALALAKLADKQTTGVLSDKTYTLENAGADKEDLVFAPYTNLNTSQKAKVASVISGVDLINQAEMLYADAVGEEYNGFGAGAVAKIKGLGRTVTTATGTDQAWEAYLNFLESNKAPIAKGLKGEVGNLAQNEQRDALKAFPGRFTSPGNAEKSFAIVRRQAVSHVETLGEMVSVGTPKETDGTNGGGSYNGIQLPN